MSPQQTGPKGFTSFVPNGSGDYTRRELAIVLIGAAREVGLDDAQHVVAVPSGFYVSDELAEAMESEAEVGEEPEVSGNAEPEPEPVQSAKKTTAKKTAKKKTSGNRAAKNTTAAEE